MTDVPIVFSAPMVRALLCGEKRMTRRLAWCGQSTKKGSLGLCRTPWARVQPGARLWVRENYIKTPAGPAYAADGDDHFGAGGRMKITPSIHMPRALSRLTLIVEAVKIEPLHAMTIEDVIAEGIAPSSPIGAFAELWNRLHGAGAWAANPEVVALSFRVLPANIDVLSPRPLMRPDREAA